jgi:hypothetical protein
MHTRNNALVTNDAKNHPSGPLFAGHLTRTLLKALPGHFFLISNIGENLLTAALEIEVTSQTSWEALWRLIVNRHLNQRSFSVFRDEESFREENLERLKVAWSSPTVQ